MSENSRIGPMTAQFIALRGYRKIGKKWHLTDINNPETTIFIQFRSWDLFSRCPRKYIKNGQLDLFMLWDYDNQRIIAPGPLSGGPLESFIERQDEIMDLTDEEVEKLTAAMLPYISEIL